MWRWGLLAMFTKSALGSQGSIWNTVSVVRTRQGCSFRSQCGLPVHCCGMECSIHLMQSSVNERLQSWVTDTPGPSSALWGEWGGCSLVLLTWELSKASRSSLFPSWGIIPTWRSLVYCLVGGKLFCHYF